MSMSVFGRGGETLAGDKETLFVNLFLAPISLASVGALRVVTTDLQASLLVVEQFPGVSALDLAA